MGRFLIIVVVLIAIAFAINELIREKRDDGTHAEKPAASPSTIEPVVPPLETEVAKPSGDSKSAEVKPTTESTVSTPASPPQETTSATAKPTPPTPPTPPETKPEAKPPTTGEPPSSEPTTDTDSKPTETGDKPTETDSKPTETGDKTAADDDQGSEGKDQDGETEILLGTADLTRGLPGGAGSLSVEEISAWVEDPANHVVLNPELPKGLAAGKSQITGLDENPLTRAKIELGRQLYFDPRLSIDGTISCASCHDPEFGYAKNTQFGVGVGGQQGGRNSPVAYNRILSGEQFWDGRADSLEAQAVGPIANPIEMGNTHEDVVNTLKGIEGYKRQFDKIFSDGVTIDNVGNAIASFERAIVTGPTPWDYHVDLSNFEQAYEADLEDLEELKEDDPELYDEYMALKQASEANPLSESAQRGGELFFSERVGCTACHAGANFTDEKHHNIGVGMEDDEPDAGRFVVTKDESHRGAFKTPTVRNVALTAPYMHDGSQATLEEVVDWYDKGGHPNGQLDEKIKKLNLTDQEKADLVAFMKSLTGEFPQVERGRLPQ